MNITELEQLQILIKRISYEEYSGKHNEQRTTKVSFNGLAQFLYDLDKRIEALENKKADEYWRK